MNATVMLFLDQDPCVQLKGTCLNGGTCVRVSWEEYSCTCPGKYLGKHCELEHGKDHSNFISVFEIFLG